MRNKDLQINLGKFIKVKYYKENLMDLEFYIFKMEINFRDFLKTIWLKVKGPIITKINLEK